jgi:hypothetical protein
MILKLLEDLIPVENIDLRYNLGQLKQILEEIQKQNSLTLLLLHSKPLMSVECTALFKNPLKITDGRYQEKPKKIGVMLLEPDEEDPTSPL